MEELTKEELIQTPKKKHRWIFMVYSVLCILFTVNCFLFITPLRLYLWLMLIIYWIIWKKRYRKWERIMDQKKIDRINELARKSKTVGLTPEEKEERNRDDTFL